VFGDHSLFVSEEGTVVRTVGKPVRSRTTLLGEQCGVSEQKGRVRVPNEGLADLLFEFHENHSDFPSFGVLVERRVGVE
jgi:hypothetical protein